MTIKSVAVALCVISTIVLGNGAAAHAQTAQTDTKPETVQAEPPAKVVVTVKAGDTLDAIAGAHGTTYVRLFNANAQIADPDIIDVGDQITIPAADEQLPDRFSQLTAVAAPAEAATPAAAAAQAVAPAPAHCDPATQWVRADNGQCLDKPGVARNVAAQPVQQAAAPAASSSTRYTGNGMWCTDYVHSRRPDVPIYGNAGYGWISSAQADGKATGTVPRPGAIAVMSGHVAYVESVNGDGSYVVSEMGWMYKAGNYHIRTVQPGTFGAFIY
jgi:surface antigen